MEGEDNEFTKLVNLCKDSGDRFGDVLLDYESLDKNILVCLLNLTMITTSNRKFKEIMTYQKLSEAITVFEEAFALLVLENNFKRWVYIGEKEVNKIMNDDSVHFAAGANEEQVGNESSSVSSSDLDSDDTMPDVLYQKKVKTGINGKETAGKWTNNGMERLNELLSAMTKKRNAIGRDKFEEKLQEIYVEHADNRMKEYNRKRQKEEMEQLNSKGSKKVCVKNVMNLVAL